MMFFKECKKIVTSMTFVLYTVAVVFMYCTQFVPGLDEPLSPPEAESGLYGTKVKEIPEVLMPSATESLVSEYLTGYYAAYPVMFYKEVRLNTEDSMRMAAIIEELTGLSKETLDGFENYQPGCYVTTQDENGNQMVAYQEAELPVYELSEALDYERFRQLMKEADILIGGGSKYSDKALVENFSQVPMTYEEATEEFELLMHGENLCKGYARLFCDYIGIAVAIVPVFVAVALWQFDKRSHMEALIYSRKMSTLRLLGTRYLALIVCMAVPVALTILHAGVSVVGLYPEKNIACLSALTEAALWILPNITMAVSVGILLTELVSPLLAVFVQGVWWYMSLQMTGLSGDISKWCLIIRHNVLGELTVFERQMEDFIRNRWMYLGVSVLLLAVTMLLYEWKRRGGTTKILRLCRK